MKGEAADVMVIGAGIFGLSAAWALLRRGRRVVVADAAAPGAGASGGPVGALVPFAPDGRSAKKAFQLAALAGAAAHWRAVAAAGGRDPGYRRVGRLVPLVSAAALARAEARADAAADRWGGAGGWRIVPAADGAGWLDPAAAPFGAVHETLSARLEPRRALAALVAALAAGGADIRCGWRASAVAEGAARFDSGRVAAAATVICTGADGGLVDALVGRGDGVVAGQKGRAALLAQVTVPAGAPLIQSGDLYVVPHGGGRVAVGSTREPAAAAPGDEGRLEAVLERAAALCPALRGAAVAARWSGLRPRAPRPEPMVGPLPGHRGIFVATGGLGIGFGVGHAVGEAVAAMVCGERPALPDGFAPEAHLALAAARRSGCRSG